MKVFDLILFFIGLAILSALYLYFLEAWRLGCAILWFIIPAYICAGLAIMKI